MLVFITYISGKHAAYKFHCDNCRRVLIIRERLLTERNFRQFRRVCKCGKVYVAQDIQDAADKIRIEREKRRQALVQALEYNPDAAPKKITLLQKFMQLFATVKRRLTIL